MNEISDFMCNHTKHTFVASPYMEDGKHVNKTIYDLACEVFEDDSGNIIIYNHFFGGNLTPNSTQNMHNSDLNNDKIKKGTEVPLVFNRTDSNLKRFRLGFGQKLEMLKVERVYMSTVKQLDGEKQPVIDDYKKYKAFKTNPNVTKIF